MTNPLLDLYLELEKNIDIAKYEKTLHEFVELWGNDIHIFSHNLNEIRNLEKFLNLLKNLELGTYSFIDGGLENSFYYFDLNIIDMFIQYGVNAVAVVINEKLITDEKYIKFIESIKTKNINIETYYKIDEKNLIYFDEVIQFCINNEIKLCIIDIDKQSEERIFKEKYKEVVQRCLKINEERNIKISISECPYLNTFNNLNINYLGGCSAGLTSCMIDKEGNVIPCMYLKDYKIGNIKEKNLKEIWNTQLFNKLRNRNNILGKCHKCKYINVCGGCRAESYLKTKELFNEDFNCWMEE